MTDEIEKAILGGIFLTEGPLPPEVYDLEPHYFEDKRLGQIFAAVQYCLAERLPTDEVSVAAIAKENGAGSCVADCLQMAAKTPTKANLSHWAKQLAEKGFAEDIHKEVVECGRDGIDPDTAMARMQDIARRSKKSQKIKGLEPIGSILPRTIREIEEEYANPEGGRAIQSGILELDDMVRFGHGELTIVAGRPGMGKTSLACNVASHCAKDVTKGAVCVFSMEMNSAQLIRRIAASLANINSQDITRKIGTQGLMDAFAKVSRMDLFVDDRSGLSVGKIHNAVSRLPKVRLIVVDYLQLIQFDKAERHDLRVGNATKDLKAMAKDYDCHVMALSQLNRSVENNPKSRPGLHNLRDSGNIEENADIVLMLYRPGYYVENEPEEDAEIIISKNRNGPVGSAWCKWAATRQQFYSGVMP